MIHSCVGCVPPERHPGCHGTCEKYLADKAAHDQRKAEMDRNSRISSAIYIDRGNKVAKALRLRMAYKR